MTDPPDSPHFNDIYIVTNLMETDLDRIIRSHQVLTDHHIQYFLYQILRGLKYVHSMNILHRDLKPSNLLVNGNCDLAICDFGLARGFDSDSEEALTEYVVTRWYRAPELLCDSSIYSKPVDVWSVGCIFAELFVHKPFFRGDNPRHQLETILSKLGCPPMHRLDFISSKAVLNVLSKAHGKPKPNFESLFPKDANPLALDLMKKMLEFIPDDRITVDDALQHPYLTDFHTQIREPIGERTFNFDFEKHVDHSGMTEAEVRACMYEEVMLYRPIKPVIRPATAFFSTNNSSPNTTNTSPSTANTSPNTTNTSPTTSYPKSTTSITKSATMNPTNTNNNTSPNTSQIKSTTKTSPNTKATTTNTKSTTNNTSPNTSQIKSTTKTSPNTKAITTNTKSTTMYTISNTTNTNSTSTLPAIVSDRPHTTQSSRSYHPQHTQHTQYTHQPQIPPNQQPYPPPSYQTPLTSVVPIDRKRIESDSNLFKSPGKPVSTSSTLSSSMVVVGNSSQKANLTHIFKAEK
eukprot:CAMPEP_0170129152 /NCGR_PEP_ID=MMETSP0020_2-20130122/21663_1 /TAXON_ID=98059 /ORGANISM="Dinobryon sp., Strain UTEXLB2267" /LENGTH=517 /DNA_ID=CAMNT_0010363343 /DNA_START=307 /DNA_END=1860 /DNA_ORIENTATION=-